MCQPEFWARLSFAGGTGETFFLLGDEGGALPCRWSWAVLAVLVVGDLVLVAWDGRGKI